ncbi:carbonic anhydrase [Romboutsia lituseburensis]|uniref:Carbonic anhydrase n=1 Tax=Romboutsia lituseburensis DSM 797 TaxID=1121325 RepID=A0A1G9IB71_9FIRM|nr:carbonic anhydrase [Romboutsia lituseburensis]CEH33969.1 Carbonic anhydrase [Romboutsia lituseburensis]SDL22500.1 carbonic anhydrase [Romboutsia lituseburensis DSM 797]
MENNKKFSLIITLSILSILAILAISTKYINESTTIETYSNTSQKSSESLNRLMKGNEKFIYASYNSSPIDSSLRKSLYQNGQKPYAVILTCSDSRVVPEDIFYTGLGELFVIRVAGNVIDDSVLGSLEYAVEDLKIPLVVVMGHQKCGAVYAAKNINELSGSLAKTIQKIVPSFEKSKALGGSDNEVGERAINFNIENSVNTIKENKVVKKHISDNSVMIIGANYNLETGKVMLLGK